jgi:hypothetical protein
MTFTVWCCSMTRWIELASKPEGDTAQLRLPVCKSFNSNYLPHLWPNIVT